MPPRFRPLPASNRMAIGSRPFRLLPLEPRGCHSGTSAGFQQPRSSTFEQPCGELFETAQVVRECSRARLLESQISDILSSGMAKPGGQSYRLLCRATARLALLLLLILQFHTGQVPGTVSRFREENSSRCLFLKVQYEMQGQRCAIPGCALHQPLTGRTIEGNPIKSTQRHGLFSG
jgi:hypothetical protein